MLLPKWQQEKNKHTKIIIIYIYYSKTAVHLKQVHRSFIYFEFPELHLLHFNGSSSSTFIRKVFCDFTL